MAEEEGILGTPETEGSERLQSAAADLVTAYFADLQLWGRIGPRIVDNFERDFRWQKLRHKYADAEFHERLDAFDEALLNVYRVAETPLGLRALRFFNMFFPTIQNGISSNLLLDTFISRCLVSHGDPGGMFQGEILAMRKELADHGVTDYSTIQPPQIAEMVLRGQLRVGLARVEPAAPAALQALPDAA